MDYKKQMEEINRELQRHLEVFDNQFKKEKIAFKKPAARKMIETSGEHLITMFDSLIKKVREEERQKYEKALEYVSHETDCIRSQNSAGQPTPDGGYEQKFAGKWYQTRPVDKSPKCNCGLDDILSQLKYEK